MPLTGDDLIDFATLVHVVKKLMCYRAGAVRLPATEAGLTLIIQLQCSVLYLMGGQPALNRAILHIGRQVGPGAAATTLGIIGMVDRG
jgi:hypothetical protein